MKRRRVQEAQHDRERLAALNELSAALYEYDSAEAVAVADSAIALADASETERHVPRPHHKGWALSSMGRLDDALDSQLSALRQFELEGT